MKVKTILAMLLLAAVMMTPSYGADIGFLDGAKEFAQYSGNVGSHSKPKTLYSVSFFRGVCFGVLATGQVDAPNKVLMGQFYTVVARYVHNHPESHHLSEFELIKKACKEAWPNENKHVFISR